MANKHGSLSIDSENLFPIIKKWLYSDHDIFYRELISNGCDAITKLKKLDMMGEYTLPADFKGKIEIIVNPEDKTIKIIDNGLGMTSDEIEEYICQIAFSGATDFIEKYKDKSTDDQIIGHFGLGFYSAFMVADEVTIDSLSYKEGSVPAHWECDGGTDYELTEGTKNTVGTEITLHLNEDCLEFANEYRAREVVEKYCSFMPTEIYLSKANAPEQYETIDAADKRDTDTVIEEIHEEAKTEEKENENGEKEIVEVSPAKEKLKIVKRPVPLNDTNPLWAKTPNDCTDEEYKDFYRKVFMDYKEPLFWIHLSMDYPFNLKGILYFPKINTEYDSIEGTIKLYNNQVFIADNIKEVIPEFLMLLKGVIDCPDLPLNVSRSALQNDGFVKKISDYITKKVADKLIGMCKTEKESYEKYWDDISPFIKYGCLKDEKFCDKMNDYILFKNLDDKYLTLPELLVKEEEKGAEVLDADGNPISGDKKSGDILDADGNPISGDDSKTDENDTPDSEDEKDERKVVYYVTDPVQQGQYVKLFKEQNMDAVILDHNIDTSFITQLEQRNEHYKFMRIDADVTESLKDESDGADLKEETDSLTETFKNVLKNDKLTVKVEKLKNENISSILTLSEEGRRMQDMMRMYSMGGNGMDMSMFAADQTLTLNANNALVKYIFEHKDSENVPMFCEQLYDLAMIQNQTLSADAMSKFVERSNKIMMLLAK
jgi:molecular chaperone HtpG